jgi:hypothetical protein
MPSRVGRLGILEGTQIETFHEKVPWIQFFEVGEMMTLAHIFS